MNTSYAIFDCRNNHLISPRIAVYNDNAKTFKMTDSFIAVNKKSGSSLYHYFIVNI